MPKEITHFILAKMTGQGLPGDSAFKAAVDRFPRLFSLGAVVPDMNFYCLSGKDAAGIRALSAPFHQSDKQALAQVLSFVDHRAGTETRLPALALAAGVVCHILADTTFHPLVHFYAGMDGVHAGATARHRQFETALDLHFWKSCPCEHRLNRLLASLEISKNGLVRLLADLFQPGPLGRQAVRRSLWWHQGIQYLFWAPWVKTGLALSRALGRPLPQKATGLVYPFEQPQALPFFSGRMVFQDPCTGQRSETCLAAMAKDAVAAALKVLALASGALAAGESLLAVLDSPDLPRIRPGIPSAGFHAWLGQKEILKVIYRGTTPLF